MDPFTNAPLGFSEEPENMRSHFSQHVETAKDFLERTSTLDKAAKTREIQIPLLGAIRDTSVIGKYSSFHELAGYTLGYRHPETIRLAYMLAFKLIFVCFIVDGYFQVLQSVGRFEDRPHCPSVRARDGHSQVPKAATCLEREHG